MPATKVSTQTGEELLRQLDASGITRAHWKIMFISGMGFFTDAYDLFIIGVVMSLLKGPWQVSATADGLVTSTALLASAIGAVLFGRIADRHGRRTAMMISVLMMCGGSLMIAIMPTYATIGAMAPVLLLFARLVQGLSVGGEYGTAATYMSEVASKGNRGFYSSFQYVTLIGGQLLALLVLVVLQALLATEQLKAWGWRIPFVIGAMAALVAMYLRRSLAETASEETMHSKEAGSLFGLLRHKRAVLIVFAFTMGGSLYFYTFTTYMQKYLVNTAHMDASIVSIIMTAVLIVYMCLQPVFGTLSDRIGRRNNMILFTALGALAAAPLLFALGQVSSPVTAFLLVLVALMIASFYTSISGVVKAELFPTEVRALGVGLTYAVANAIFGGTAEYVALWLKSSDQEQWFAWYVSGIVAMGLAASLIMPDTRKYGYLEGTGQIER